MNSLIDWIIQKSDEGNSMVTVLDHIKDMDNIISDQNKSYLQVYLQRKHIRYALLYLFKRV